MNRIVLVIILLGTLAACGVPAAPAPTAAPTAAPVPTLPPPPTLAPTATAVPTAAPAPTTATPSEGIRLPTALYILNESQIFRIERDATTITQITNETPIEPGVSAVVDFSVSPRDGSLAYTLQTAEGGQSFQILLRADADGANRTILLDKSTVINPIWSPDGSQIAYQLGVGENAPEKPGIYVLPVGGGEPRLLIEAALFSEVDNPEARAYDPVAWSPDGTKLLVAAYLIGIERCDAGVLDVASGTVTIIQAANDMVSSDCYEALAWNADGSAVYVGMRLPGLSPPVPGLWRADVQTGAVTQIIPETINEQFAVVASPFAAGDRLLIQLAQSEQLPDPIEGRVPSFGLAAAAADGSNLQQLRSEGYPTFRALWAPDGSGAVVQFFQEERGVVVLWLPSDGSAAVELPVSGEELGEMHWGR